jgi:iron only hydrogenase large subunit-like protein
MPKELSPEVSELIKLLENKTKLVAMIAPSFPVVFNYSEIIGMLKRLGFKYVVEVARGAEETNKQLLALMKLHPDRKYITNPCPTIVRLIRNKYQYLLRYLTPIDSPMIATAKIVAKEYPKYKKVFIGPCIAKKLEAKEDYPELDILVLTYKELQDVFKYKNISPEKTDKSEHFDLIAQETRLYPVSGGLSQSSKIIKKFTDPEYDVISGTELSKKALDEFIGNYDLKILDILNCDGGCINGPGIVSSDSLDRRRQKVISYWKRR